jgi:aspartate aminotransferase
MTRVASSFANAPRSAVREMLERALARPDTIRLELGDPDFTTPRHIVEAALRAASDGFTHYTASSGLASVREAAAARVRTVNGFDCTPEEVVVTTGACGGLHALLRVLADPGDDVLVPDPGWTGYAAIAASVGASVRPYALDRGSRFGLDVEAVERAVTPRTRAIVVNSPSNPAGSVASREALAALVELAARHDCWLVSDEAYESFVFDATHVSAAASAEGPVISVFTCSKTYAMTGWRVGYLVAPRDVAVSAARAQESVVSSVSSVSQKAAEAALTGPQDAVEEMRATYRHRLELATSLLDELGVPYVRPAGAFYLLVDVSAAGVDSRTFALALLDEHGVAVVPGSAFGTGAEGLVRVSLCVADDAISEGLRRLGRALAASPAP